MGPHEAGFGVGVFWGYFRGEGKGVIPPMPLTDMKIKKANPAERNYKLADGEGLFVLVKANGSKLWQMKYRYRGKEKLLSFGAYPKVGISAARDLKTIARGALAEGKDPMVHKPSRDFSAEKTFRAVATNCHNNRLDSIKPDHANRVWSRLERDVFPALGDLLLTEITPPIVLRVIKKIEERGALDISRRAKQCIGQVFQFAIASGLCDFDPTANLGGALKPKPRVKHMAKVLTSELPELLRKIEGYKDEASRRSDVTKAALSFAFLTWVRTSELRFAEKDEFEGLDGPTPVWRIPKERMKMEREHLVPLSSQAVSIVKAMIARSDCNYIFPGTKPNKPISENTMIYGLYRLGYHSRQTVHGFRSLASTWANEQLVPLSGSPTWMRKYDKDWVEMQLAHSDDDEVRDAYNSAEYLVPRRGMMQDWADYLDRCRSGEGALRLVDAA